MSTDWEIDHVAATRWALADAEARLQAANEIIAEQNRAIAAMHARIKELEALAIRAAELLS